MLQRRHSSLCLHSSDFTTAWCTAVDSRFFDYSAVSYSRIDIFFLTASNDTLRGLCCIMVTHSIPAFSFFKFDLIKSRYDPGKENLLDQLQEAIIQPQNHQYRYQTCLIFSHISYWNVKSIWNTLHFQGYTNVPKPSKARKNLGHLCLIWKVPLKMSQMTYMLMGINLNTSLQSKSFCDDCKNHFTSCAKKMNLYASFAVL